MVELAFAVRPGFYLFQFWQKLLSRAALENNNIKVKWVNISFKTVVRRCENKRDTLEYKNRKVR